MPAHLLLALVLLAVLHDQPLHVAGDCSALRPGANLAAAKTRFKTWYQVVGSTVEHAAALAGHDIDFGGLFLAKESEEESNASLHDVLMALSTKWPAVSVAKETAGFQATDVARWINDRESSFMPDWGKEGGIVLRDFLFPEQTDKSGTFIVSAKSVGRRLKKHCGEPVFTIVDGLPRSITLLNKPKPEYDPNAAAVFWMRLS
jgi:hypothetical protein